MKDIRNDKVFHRKRFSGREYEEPRPSKVVRNRPVSAYQDGYSVYRISDGEIHWAVEMTKSEALESHAVKSLGYGSVKEYVDDMGSVRVNELFPHEKIKVIYDNGRVVERKAWEWAIDHRGVFCSTCW
jgi:hypothetical protein